MNDRNIDAITRNAATAISRRTSLLSIGGAALTAAMTVPALAKPGKSGKSALKRCKKQTGQCRIAIAEHCAPLEEPQICEAFLGACCETLAQCNAGLTITCLLTIVAS